MDRSRKAIREGSEITFRHKNQRETQRAVPTFTPLAVQRR